jgi:hypothetical protein
MLVGQWYPAVFEQLSDGIDVDGKVGANLEERAIETLTHLGQSKALMVYEQTSLSPLVAYRNIFLANDDDDNYSAHRYASRCG